MKIKKLSPGIYHAETTYPKELAMTFLRFEESYESTKFRGRFFTLLDFRKWFVKSAKIPKKRRRLYYKSWEAFNIPSFILKPFYNGKFNPLSDEERSLLNEAAKIKERKFCIIGTSKKTTRKYLKHEIAHCLYFLHWRYRHNARKILHQIDKIQKKKLLHILSKEELYSDNVLIDELHAYLLTELDFFDRGTVNVKSLKPIQIQLKKNFDNFLKN